MQHGKVIAYAYRKLKVHEKNYPTHDLELAALVFALKILRHYLYDVHVDVFRPQESSICVHSKRIESPTNKVVELLKYYDMNVLYHLGKVNMVVNALSRMTMGSVSHVKEGKEELVKDVNRLSRLSDWLEDSSKGGFMVNHNSESSLVVEVKSKQHLDPLLIELKESILSKLNNSFSQ